MPNLNMKAVFEALLPPGSLWQPAPSAGFDQFLTVLGENADDIHERLYDLGSLRDPRKTPILSDLEKEYGVYSDDRLTEAVRRQQLAAVKYAKPGTAADSDLQTILRNAGFDVYVRRNHPVIDPADLLLDQYLLEAGEIDAFAGEPNAIAGLGGGELLVNGPIVVTSVDYDAQADGAAMFAGEPSAVAGYFDGTTYTPVTYEIPANSDYWPYIFFISGQEWGHLNDWNMEYSGVSKWIPVTSLTDLLKNIDVSKIDSGIRSMRIQWTGGSVILGTSNVSATQYLDDIITNPCTITAAAWGGGPGTSIKPIMEILDPVTGLWLNDIGSTSSVIQQTLSITAPNGVEAVRIGITSGALPPVSPSAPVYFDQILIETEQITRAQIPSEREAEFKRLILKYKPLDTWAGLIVDYV